MHGLSPTHVHECPTCGYRGLVRRKTLRGFLTNVVRGVRSGILGESRAPDRPILDAETGPRLFLLPFSCVQCGTRNLKHVILRAGVPIASLVLVEALAIGFARAVGAGLLTLMLVQTIGMLPGFALVARLARADITIIRRLPDAIPTAVAQLRGDAST